jgi:hypothetical protein
MPAQHRHLPIYLKGQEIFELTAKIIDLIPDGDEILNHIKGLMLEDAAFLTVNVSSAEAGDLYDIRMENAAIIRKAARDLSSHCTTLELYGFSDTHYLELIREELETYKILFRAWVQSFDQWNYVVDDWGLFNPPGVSPDNYE